MQVKVIFANVSFARQMQQVTSCGVPAGAPRSLPAVVGDIYSQGTPRTFLGTEPGMGKLLQMQLYTFCFGPKVKKLIKKFFPSLGTGLGVITDVLMKQHQGVGLFLTLHCC